MKEIATVNLGDDGLMDDMGVFETHPELVQPHPSASAEWLEHHKPVVISIGWAACFIAGAVTRRAAAHRHMAVA